jgi:TRAP-type C4-dicarboxylate transport system permease small subunit
MGPQPEREPASQHQGAPTPAFRPTTLWGLADAILFVCVLGMLITVTIQVLSRLLGGSAPWTEELSRFLFIWTAFFGMSVGFRYIQHPRLTLLLNVLPPWFSRLAVHLYALAGIAFFALVGYYAALLVQRQYTVGETSPVLGVGMFIVTLPLAVSAVLAIVAHVQSVYLDAATRERLERHDELAP